jgi:hypothetical protein
MLDDQELERRDDVLEAQLKSIMARPGLAQEAFPDEKIRGKIIPSPFQVRSATVQHRRHGGVNGRGKGQGQYFPKGSDLSIVSHTAKRRPK